MDQNKAEEDRIDYPFAYGFLESRIKAIVEDAQNHRQTYNNITGLITEAIEEARAEGREHFKRYGK